MSLIAVHNHVALFHIDIAPSTFLASFTLSLFFFTYLVISGFIPTLRFPSINPIPRLFRRRSSAAPATPQELALSEAVWRTRKALPAVPQQERLTLQLTDYEHDADDDDDPFARLESPSRSALRSFFSSNRRASSNSGRSSPSRKGNTKLQKHRATTIEISELEGEEDDNNYLSGPEPARRLVRRLPRSADAAADAAAILRPLPVGALGLRGRVVRSQYRARRGSVKGGDGGRERQRSFFSFRRWLQPASLAPSGKR
jgi:hypothetical protein